MEQQSRRTVIRFAIGIGTLVALFSVFTSTVGIYTDWLWFASLGQLSTYQTQLWTRVGLWLAGALLVMGVLVINWLVIPRRLLSQLRLHLRSHRQQQLVVGSRVLTIGLRVVQPSSPW